MNELAIRARGIVKAFGRSPRVLDCVDLNVPIGTVVGLLGTNGCGKSTLIKCLLGLLRVDEGRAEILGEDAWDLSGAAKGRIGYVPQEPKFYPWMRARHLIAYTASFYDRWDHALVDELTRRWQVPEDQRVGTLSPGQLHKLGIVLAMGYRPDLLILDEPVASLDPIARREFLKSLLEVSRDAARTILFSTHITSDLERVASHVAILKRGRVACFEELDDLKESVKRLRITSGEPLPPDFSVSGALRTEVHGRGALVAVPSVTPALIDELRRRWNADVAVEDLNLEEIFLELHDTEDAPC